jgi:hypothetical protein
VQRPNLIFEGVVAGNKFSTALKKDPALLSWDERPFRPLDQLNAEPALKLPDHLAGPRLRNAIIFSRAGKAPPSDDIAEDLQAFQIHAGPSTKSCRGILIPGALRRSPSGTALLGWVGSGPALRHATELAQYPKNE